MITGKVTLTVEIEGNANRPLDSSETSRFEDAIKPIAKPYFPKNISGKEVEGQLLEKLDAVLGTVRSRSCKIIPWHSKQALYQMSLDEVMITESEGFLSYLKPFFVDQLHYGTRKKDIGRS